MQPLKTSSTNVLQLNRERRNQGNQQQPRREMDPRNGHEAILRTMIKKKARAVLVFNDGTSIVGRISQFDHFTITIYPDDNAGLPETFFKHGIRSFTCEPQLDSDEE